MERIKTLLITGSNGFVGQSFLKHISNLPSEMQPNEIVLVNRNSPVIPNLELKNKCTMSFVMADLTKPWKINQNISHVLNLAGDGSVNAYSKESAQNFIKICNNLSDWAMKNKPEVIVHASSGACFYNTLKDISFKDKQYLIDSRIQGEIILEGITKNAEINVLSARLFTFIGPNILDKMQYAASFFIRNAIENRLITVSGNSKTIRSYMHQSTMSDWIYKCLVRKEPEGIVSIGSPVAVTIEELVDFISSRTNAKVIFNDTIIKPSVYIPNLDREFDYLGVTEGPKWQDSMDECINIYSKRR
jgi:nucleoside-diphosphate-sugar epimerase